MPAPKKRTVKRTSPAPTSVQAKSDAHDRNGRRADDVDRAIAARLREARENAGLTQKQFADRLDVSYQQLQKYERCQNRVSGSVLHRSAQVLGIKEADLFPPAEAQPASGQGQLLAARPPAPAPTRHADPRAHAPLELGEFTDICERILRLNSPRLKRALLAVVEQSLEEDIGTG